MLVVGEEMGFLMAVPIDGCGALVGGSHFSLKLWLWGERQRF